MIRRFLPAVGLFLAMLVTGSAQPPFAWWENPVASGLTLSDAQRDRINAIVSEHRERLTQERMEAERAEREFESVINADTVDWKRGRLAIEQLVKARSVFTEDISRMTLKLRTVLTAEQWRTLQSRSEGRGRGPRPEGRGPRSGGFPPQH